MNFKQCNPANYQKGRKEKIKYIVIHYTANNGDTAKNNADYFASGARRASAHYFVDEKEVWQSVKDEDKAWHCGGKLQSPNGHKFYGKCYNGNSIGIEMCSRKDGNGRYYIKSETINNTANLTKNLMEKYNIPTNRVIRHYDVTGKNCPEPFVRNPAQWENFLKRLKAEEAEVEKEIKIKLNGKLKTVKAINKDGFNYIKLQDLRDDKIEIGYDGTPIINAKGC